MGGAGGDVPRQQAQETAERRIFLAAGPLQRDLAVRRHLEDDFVVLLQPQGFAASGRNRRLVALRQCALGFENGNGPSTIGRASCRDRVGQYVVISGVAESY